MRIIVVADTHARTANLKKLCLKQRDADVFIHLGDGIDDIDRIREQYTNCSFITIRGNVDFGSKEPKEKLLVLEEKRIFMTHGHKYGVKTSYDALLNKAKEQSADILLFGHTHAAFYTYADGVYILNPGSLELPQRDAPRFGIIDIIDGSITAYLAEL